MPSQAQTLRRRGRGGAPALQRLPQSVMFMLRRPERPYEECYQGPSATPGGMRYAAIACATCVYHMACPLLGFSSTLKNTDVEAAALVYRLPFYVEGYLCTPTSLVSHATHVCNSWYSPPAKKIVLDSVACRTYLRFCRPRAGMHWLLVWLRENASRLYNALKCLRSSLRTRATTNL